MRNDNIGLFWEDLPRQGTVNTTRIMPEIPETGWRPPAYFPDLSGAACISLDTETFDPELIDHGPGWARGKGHIVGVSVGVPGGFKWYFPMRHTIGKEDNMNPEHVLAWLKYTLQNANQPKIGANLLYDIGWLRQEGVEVAGELVDVQYAEALLSENSQIALEVMAKKYLQEGKQSNLLYNWCADFYTGSPSPKQRANIYRAPPKLVGPYAESDADLPLRLMDKLYPLLIKENLYNLFRMECDLIRFVLEMRWAGVRVDIDEAVRLKDILAIREKDFQKRLDDEVGQHVDINASASLAKAFDKLGVAYPRTAPSRTHVNGQPSFKKEFLEELEHPIGELIREIRKCAKLRGTFIESYILNSHINGKVYGQFHPLRSDEGGTRSGRYSSSTPNLQNLPSRDSELAPLVRGIFRPDIGHVQWRRYDYSQIEYRFLAHFAVGPSGVIVRQSYWDDPDIDYHEMVQLLVLNRAGLHIARKPIKTINFGLIYGMGKNKLTRSVHLTPEKGNELFKAYHEGAPFAKATMEACSDEAARNGTVETILGRKSRFDLWEPDGRTKGTALPYEQAIRLYGKVRRAYLHKALNRKLQGSAADLMKMSTWKNMKDGVFARTGYPRITVHDELDFSDPGNCDDAFKEMQHNMETAITLLVPVKADMEIGPDWGHAKKA